jgi:UDP-N-acetylglucosamine 1-carboxyvinyltransferase
MNADIRIEGNNAVLKGGRPLRGAKVVCSDLRAGAALVLAGIAAEGTTEISEIYHIERGYSNFIEKIRDVGGTIERAEE